MNNSMIDKNIVFSKIKKELNINIYEGESQESFVRRLVYSGMAQWMKYLAFSTECIEHKKIKKALLHRRSKEVLDSYIKAYPQLEEYFLPDDKVDPINVIRNALLRSGELVEIGFDTEIVTGENIFHSDILESTSTRYSGLAEINDSSVDVLEVLKRFNIPLVKGTDLLKKYIDNAKWEVNEDFSSYEQFVPEIDKVLSQCWRTNISIDDKNVHMVRKSMSIGTYDYQLAKKKDEKIYISKFSEYAQDSEIRDTQRLLYALKAKYNHNSKVTCNLYNHYTKWTFWSMLPPAEMNLLRYIGWPEEDISNRKQSYLVRNELNPVVEFLIKLLEIIKEDY